MLLLCVITASDNPCKHARRMLKSQDRSKRTGAPYPLDVQSSTIAYKVKKGNVSQFCGCARAPRVQNGSLGRLEGRLPSRPLRHKFDTNTLKARNWAAEDKKGAIKLSHNNLRRPDTILW